MDASPPPNRQDRCYELRFADLFNTGLGYVFPWDAQGKVNLAVPSERVFDIPVGAHIMTSRRWYTHHGIYVGAGQVVHYQGLSSSLRRGPVAKVSLAEFAHGRPVHVHGEADAAYSGIEAAARACSRLGEDAYDVLRNNCEHFCFWCLVGAARSPQVDRLLLNPRAVALAAQVLGGLIKALDFARDALPLAN